MAKDDPVTNPLTGAVTLRDSSLSSLLFWTDRGNPGLSVSDSSGNKVCYSICHQFENRNISYILDFSVNSLGFLQT